jgi:hypothetical protein
LPAAPTGIPGASPLEASNTVLGASGNEMDCARIAPTLPSACHKQLYDGHESDGHKIFDRKNALVGRPRSR